MDKRIEHLLKSSLILEHEVAAIIAECGFHNQGEFSYSRANESGEDTDFSVDLLAIASAGTGATLGELVSLGLLIECKYASPSVEWVFSKVARHEPEVLSTLSVFNWLGPYMATDLSSLNTLESRIYCNRGVSLSSTTADPQKIRHGLQQLRYALPHALHSHYSVFKGNDEGLPIPVLGSLLVTNAPIRVLNDDVSLSQAASCQSLDMLTTVHSHISVYQRASPELKLACQRIAKVISETLERPAIRNIESSLTDTLIDSIESVTVISLDALPAYLNKARDAVQNLKVMSRGDFVERYRKLSTADK
ncbi:hypothetical protein NPS29_11340 [Pseudomonas putida]|uniref:hypothetical protein n=1 Tax=Pseudomonas putida TaxID=303 RepID=UPI002363F59C|nr:hypothetical protein [Pseudomonas putida]MDD1965916.1 hypothetical protein [Pseudomonas putida]